MSEHYPSLVGPKEVRSLLDELWFLAFDHKDPNAMKYDWENIQLWEPEHRHGNINNDICMQVWKEMTMVASQVLREK